MKEKTEKQQAKQTLPIKIPLEYPIKSFGEEVKVLEIKRRPTTRDIKIMDETRGEVGKSAALLALLSDMPESSIDSMDGADFIKAAEVVGNFLA